MAQFSWFRFVRAFGRPLVVGGALVAAYALLNREPRAQGVVLAGPHQAVVDAVVRDLHPFVGDGLDTLDLRTPGVFHLALRLPSHPGRVPDMTAALERAGREHVAALYWSALRRELGAVVGDTVRIRYRRGTTWSTGLPGQGRSTGESTFSARRAGWLPLSGWAVYGVRPGA